MINLIEEKLLCHILVSDDIAEQLSPDAADAFWRAFIVQDRKTGAIRAKFRFSYKKAGKRWIELVPKNQSGTTEEQVQQLRADLELMLVYAANMLYDAKFATTVKQKIQVFYPPDDGGDGGNTVDWLIKQDLLEIKSIEKMPLDKDIN